MKFRHNVCALIFLITFSGYNAGAVALSAGPLLSEAQRELGLMRTTSYQHITDVDEPSGRFDYDCSGLIDYALRRVAPAAYAELPISRKKSKRPLAQDFYAVFSQPSATAPHWSSVARAIDLKPGDIISWLKPEEAKNKNTGHVMIVRDVPNLDPQDPNQVLVAVIDSTESPHSHDSRPPGASGLGTGTLGLMINAQGAPVAYRWKGVESTKTQAISIALGHLNE